MLVCVEQDVRKNCCYCVNLPPSRLPLSRSPLHSPLWQANSRGLAKHFHAAQLSAQQLRDGFCTRGTDWAQVRSVCTKMVAASAAADGGPSGLRGVTSAMRRLRNRGGAAAGGALHRRPFGASSASASGPLARQPRSSASSSLRALLCRCYLRAARTAAAAAAGGEEDGSDTTSDEDDDDNGSGTTSSSDADQESYEGGSGEPTSKASSEGARGSGGTARLSGNHLADETGQPLPSGAFAAITPRPLSDEVSGASASDAAPAASAIDTAPPGLPRSCWSCGTEGCGLKKCSRCRRASYCSAACQSAHWREHRAECGVWVGERQQRREAAAADRASSLEGGSLTRLAAVD